MIEVLAQGQLTTKPEARTDVRGKIYTTATVQVEEQFGTREYMYLISHIPRIGMTLQSMDVGDSVCVSGSLTIRREEGRVTFGCNVRKMLSFHPTMRHD